MAAKADTKVLSKDTVITDETVFYPYEKVQEAVLFTEEQWEDASAFYRAKVDRNGKGRVPTAKALKAWVEAGCPEVNSDDIRMERLAVSEGAGKPWHELNAEQYENYRKNWELAGKPEPLEFLPKGTRAKLIGYELENGVETDHELIIHIPSEMIDEYRRDNGITTGPSSLDVYLNSSEELWKGVITVHTVQTVGRTINLKDGKAVNKSEALKSQLQDAQAQAEAAKREAEELKKAIAAAMEAGDMNKLAELMNT